MSALRRHVARAAGLGVLAIAVAWPDGSLAQTEADSVDASGAQADSTAARDEISTDGAVTVYEETVPGEGIEGFWWEYDAQADLVRLLDARARGVRLEPIVDEYGFQLVIPESITALRDSVTAVADSILAATITVGPLFDPKFKSSYNERKDEFDFSNEFDVAVPLREGTTVTTKASTRNTYNESTKKDEVSRTISSSFNLRFDNGLNAAVTLSRSNDQQERERQLEAASVNSVLGSSVRRTQEFGPIGSLELIAGLSANQRDYENRALPEGRSRLVTPDWSAKHRASIAGGNADLTYTGNAQTGTREETRTITELDDQGNVIASHDSTSSTTETNARNRVTASYDRKFDTGSVTLSGGAGAERFQFLSQLESFGGQQETRTQTDQSARLRFDYTPRKELRFAFDVNASENESDYELDLGRFTNTSRRAANADITYDDAWQGASFRVKMDREFEDRNYRTPQAGTVEGQSLSGDYKQRFTEGVDLTSTYAITLDSFKFDDVERNTGDRDLLNQRATFTVRYVPVKALTTALKMEVRTSESVNIRPEKSNTNKTDYAYLVNPSYTFRIGKANLTGDLNADARYAVFDFNEDQNFLTRVFSARQRWQQQVSQRLSTEVQAEYRVSDEGSFRREVPAAPRLFARARETRKYFVDAQVLYSPAPGVKANAKLRQDGDDQYNVSGDERTLTVNSVTTELSYGVTVRRELFEHVSIDFDVSRAQKRGDRVRDVDREFFRIRAVLEYRPFEPKETTSEDGDR